VNTGFSKHNRKKEIVLQSLVEYCSKTQKWTTERTRKGDFANHVKLRRHYKLFLKALDFEGCTATVDLSDVDKLVDHIWLSHMSDVRQPPRPAESRVSISGNTVGAIDTRPMPSVLGQNSIGVPPSMPAHTFTPAIPHRRASPNFTYALHQVLSPDPSSDPTRTGPNVASETNNSMVPIHHPSIDHYFGADTPNDFCGMIYGSSVHSNIASYNTMDSDMTHSDVGRDDPSDDSWLEHFVLQDTMLQLPDATADQTYIQDDFEL
jgi:hypothetical protein